MCVLFIAGSFIRSSEALAEISTNPAGQGAINSISSNVMSVILKNLNAQCSYEIEYSIILLLFCCSSYLFNSFTLSGFLYQTSLNRCISFQQLGVWLVFIISLLELKAHNVSL